METPKEKVVPAHFLNSEDLRCPACHGNDLVLEGFAQRRYATEVHQGKMTEEQWADEPWQHDVKVITCLNPNCQQITRVISIELWELMNQVTMGAKPC